MTRVQRSMVEVSSTADKEKALKDQEIVHLKAQEIELRKREAELSEELKQVTLVKDDERKVKENTI